MLTAVRRISAGDLGPQLFASRAGAPARRDAFLPVQDVPGSTVAQPAGGLWTATYDPVQGSAFLVHLRQGMARALAVYNAMGLNYGDTRPLPWNPGYTVLTPAPMARIAMIDNYADCVALWDRYSRPSPASIAALQPRWVSWEAVAADWDAVHLTARAATDAPWVHTTAADRRRPHLAWWGHECTLWLRWAFTRVRTVAGARLDLSPISAQIVTPPTDAELGTRNQLVHWERRVLGLLADPLVLWAAQPDELGRVLKILAVLEQAQAQDPPRPDAVALVRQVLGNYHQIWVRRGLQAGWFPEWAAADLAAEGWGRAIRSAAPTGTCYEGYVLWTI